MSITIAAIPTSTSNYPKMSITIKLGQDYFITLVVCPQTFWRTLRVGKVNGEGALQLSPYNLESWKSISKTPPRKNSKQHLQNHISRESSRDFCRPLGKNTTKCSNQNRSSDQDSIQDVDTSVHNLSDEELNLLGNLHLPQRGENRTTRQLQIDQTREERMIGEAIGQTRTPKENIPPTKGYTRLIYYFLKVFHSIPYQ